MFCFLVSVFRRPFCLDFLNFCFERFEVAIWSSRMKYSSLLLCLSLVNVGISVNCGFKRNIPFCCQYVSDLFNIYNNQMQNVLNVFQKECG